LGSSSAGDLPKKVKQIVDRSSKNGIFERDFRGLCKKETSEKIFSSAIGY
jgi:hypothetical protein